MQLVSSSGFSAPPSNHVGWLAQLGIMVEDLYAVLLDGGKWDVKALRQGRNWLQLPDGLAIEIMQATGNAVAEALAVNPRAV